MSLQLSAIVYHEIASLWTLLAWLLNHCVGLVEAAAKLVQFTTPAFVAAIKSY